MRYAPVLAVLFLGITPPADAQSTIPNDSSSLSPGIGYDTLIGTVRGRCVIIDPTGAQPVSGEEVNFRLQDVQSEYQLDSYLNISASAKYGGFVSGSASVTQESKINRFSSYMFVSIAVITRRESVISDKLKTPVFTQAAASLLRTNPQRFRKQCGDQFVAGRALGGEYTAVVEIQTSDQSDKMNVDAKISAASGVFSGTTEGSKRLSEITKDRRVRVMVIRGGGSGGIVITPDQLLSAVQSFPADIKGKPASDLKPYSVTLQDYLSLDLPTGAKTTSLNDDPRRDFVEDADIFVERQRSRLADIKYVIDHPDQFQEPDLNTLSGAIQPIQAQLTTVTRQMRDCVKNGSCGRFVAPNVAEPPIPARIPGLTRQQLLDQLASANANIQVMKGAFSNTFSDFNRSNKCSQAAAQSGAASSGGPAGFGIAALGCAKGSELFRDQLRTEGGF